MTRGPIIHGALLAAALLLAYQTWTRDKTVETERGDFTVWQADDSSVQAIAYDTERKTVRVERRDGYLWGTTTRTVTPPRKPPTPTPAAGDAGPVEAAAEPEPEPETITKEFPVGEQGSELFGGFAPLKALRELGTLDDEQKKEYGLAESKTQITVSVGGKQRSLIVGDRVYGGSDRYVLDADSGKAYVIAGDIVSPLEGSEAALRERNLLPFEPPDVKQAALETPAQKRELVRGEKQGPHGQPLPTWAYAETPDDEDQTLANLMNRIEKLAPLEYVPDKQAEGLELVVRVAYTSKDGKRGTLEVFREPGEAEGTFEYYMRTDKTRVLGKLPAPATERVAKDLEQLLAPPE